MWKRITIGSALLFTGCTAGLTGTTYGGGPSGPTGGPPPTEYARGDQPGGARSDRSLAERGYWTKLQEETDDLVKKINDQCHARITASFVKESFRGLFTAGGNYGLEVNVRVTANSSVRAVLDVCTESDMNKQAVASNIRHIEIEFGNVRYALDKGVFHATINTDDDQVSTYQRAMVAFLKETL